MGEVGGGVGLVEHELAAILRDRDGGLRLALGGQQHDRAAIGAAAGQPERRDQRQDLTRAARAHSSTLTMNSVPRTPRIAAGVRTVTASGDRLAMRPETTASVPLLSTASKRPSCVTGS